MLWEGWNGPKAGLGMVGILSFSWFFLVSPAECEDIFLK
jgi:hypothetical protein